MHSLCSQDLYVKRRYFIIYKYHVTRYNIIGYNTVYFCIYLYVTYFDICNYICLDTSYHFSALYLLLKYCSFFFKNSCTNIFHRRSLYAFYSNRNAELQVYSCSQNLVIWEDVVWTEMAVDVGLVIFFNKRKNIHIQDHLLWSSSSQTVLIRGM